MKQQKSDSIFSVLSTLLVVSKWTLLFIIATGALAALNAPFFPLTFGADPADPDAKWPTFFIGLAFEEDMTRAAYVLEIFVAIMLSGVGLYVIHHLSRILQNVRNGYAFARENGLRLRKAGYAAAYGQLAVYGIWFIALILRVSGRVDFEGVSMAFTPAPWLGILGAFALSTIFLEGADIKEEQDLTV